MEIKSTNAAVPTTFIWKEAEVTTGIFKRPTGTPIFLSTNEVVGDEISDRIHHGGYYKACYLFSAEEYPFWKKQYPDLDWTWGMFGENLTVTNYNPHQVFLGDVYRVGEALVQISQYREPCYKLGYKFGDQKVIQQFIDRGNGGTYLSILEEGEVNVKDPFILVNRLENSITVAALFQLVYAEIKDPDLLKIASLSNALSPKKREWFASFLK
ncbi:MAG: MOSC domain-containing protein [Bacteroidetes bacterium]|nr:MOSC domain-containing protein [Bacteroidota bacterium]MDA0985624.1 MOSC domain-containing protein [Bacteroidota bacterium]